MQQPLAITERGGIQNLASPHALVRHQEQLVMGRVVRGIQIANLDGVRAVFMVPPPLAAKEPVNPREQMVVNVMALMVLGDLIFQILPPVFQVFVLAILSAVSRPMEAHVQRIQNVKVVGVMVWSLWVASEHVETSLKITRSALQISHANLAVAKRSAGLVLGVSHGNVDVHGYAMGKQVWKQQV